MSIVCHDVIDVSQVCQSLLLEEERAVAFQALRIEAPADGRTAWTVVDEGYEVHPEAAAWLYSLRFGADRAENTCRSYARHIAAYLTWLSETGRDWRSVTSKDVASFVVWLERTPDRRRRAPGPTPLNETTRAPNTINAITTAVREFYRWSYAHDRVPEPVVRRFERARIRKRVPRPAPKALSTDQVRQVVAACRSARDVVLVLLMWRCGLRISEALGLRIEDMHFLPSSTHLDCDVAGPHVHVVRRDNENGASAKSRQPRWVPADASVVDAYRRYRWERDDVPSAAATSFVFVNLKSGVIGAPMTPSAAEDLFRRLTTRCGFKVEPHMLRHSFGTALAEVDVPADLIQVLMGHASIQSTERYLHASWERMCDAVDRLAARYPLPVLV
ncbi:tyrosine-type recombinase/integrase [Mycobacterium sp.]|uniref:tyrosine-type recombinase/integrase n=1 Tax=Mycobacterium sp. TaxID=1785 RepID=UPI003BABD6CD